MAQNVGNLSFALGLDLNPLKQSMAEADAMLNRLKDNFAKAGTVPKGRYAGTTGSLAGTNRITEDYKDNIANLKKAWDSINWNNPSKAKKSVMEIVEAYRQVQKNIGEAGMTLEQFIRTQDKAALTAQKKNERLANSRVREQLKPAMGFDQVMSLPENTIAQRTDKIRELINVRRQLNTADAQGEAQLRSLNASMQRLNNENQRAITTGIQVENQTKKMGAAWAWALRKAALYFSVAMINRFMTRLVEVRGEFELQQKSLAAIIQNKEEADKIFARTVDLALKSPFQLKELITYTRELSAYRIETEKLFDTTKMLADVSAGLGVDMGRLILAYGQVRSAAVLRGQELRQFTEAGIPIIAELAAEFGKLEGRVVKTGEVFEKVSRREVPFAMVDKIFKKMTQEGGVFYRMQEKQAETLKGKWSNLRDAYDIMLNKIGEGNDGALKDAMDTARFLTMNYEFLIDNIYLLITAFGVMKLQTIGMNSVMSRLAVTVDGAATSMKIFGRVYTQETLKAAIASTTRLNAILLKTGVALKGLGLSIKAAFVAAWPMLLIAGLVEGILWINNYNRKVKELRDANESLNISTAKSTDDIINQVRELQKLATATDDDTDAKNRRIEILSNIAKTEGEYASQLEKSVTNLEELKRLEEERARRGNLQMYLNDAMLESAGGGKTTLKERMAEMETLGRKSEATLGSVMNQWLVVRQNIEKSLVDMPASAERTLLESIVGADPKEAMKSFETLFLAIRGDAVSLKSAFKDLSQHVTAYEKWADAEKAARKYNKELKVVNEQSQDMIVNIKDYITATFGTLGDITSEQKRAIEKDLITAGLGERIVKTVMFQIDPANLRTANIALEGWRKDFSRILGKDFAKQFTSTDEATRLSAIKQATELYEQLSDEMLFYQGVLSMLSDSEKIRLNELQVLVPKLKELLNVHKQEIKGEKGKTQVDRLQDQANVLKEASEAYKKYLSYMDAEAAKNRVLAEFKGKKGFTLDAATSQEGLASALTRILGSLKALNTEAARDAADKIESEIRSTRVEMEVTMSSKSRDNIVEGVKRALEDYNLRMELEGLTGIKGLADPSSMTDAAAMASRYNNAISELKRRGGEEDIKQAKELEEEFNKWLLNRKTSALKEISQLVEQNATREQKIDMVRAKMALEEQKVAILDSIESTGLVVLTEQQKIDRQLSKQRIKGWELELISLEEIALKSTGVFQQLFGNVGDLTLTELKMLTQRAKDITQDAVIDGDKVKIKFKELDGSIVETTITLENYLSVLNKTADIEKDIASKQPFKQAEAFFKKGGEYAANAARGRKELRAMRQEMEGLAEGSAAYDNALKKMEEKTDDIQANSKMASEAYQQGVEAAANGLRSMSNFVGMIGEVMESLGASKETVETIKDVQKGLTVVIGLLELVAATMAIVQASSGVIGLISLAIAAVAGAIVSLVSQQGRAIDRMVKEQEIQLERLTRKYDQFSKERDKAASSRTLRQYTSEMVDNLRYQEYAISRMIMAERNRRNQDEEALRDLANQLEDVRIKQKEVFDDYIEELRGTNLKSASEEFADTWIEAFLQGENAMDAFQTKFSEMIQTMLVKQAALRVMGNILEPFFQSIDNALGDDGELSQTELSRIMNEIPGYIKMLESTSEAILKPLMETVGLTAGSQAQAASGLQAGIESIQEDTAQQLVALLNTMRYQMYASAERSIAMEENIDLMAQNSVEMLVVQTEIRNLVKEMRNWQEAITAVGHQKGGRGLKVFND